MSSVDSGSSTIKLIPSTDVIQLTLTLKMTSHRLSKRQSLSTTTVLFRTTFTRTIILNLVMHLYIVRPYRLSVNIFLSVVGFFFGSLSILSLFAATLINFMRSYRKHESDEHYPLLYFFNQIWVMFFLFFFNHMSGPEKNISA